LPAEILPPAARRSKKVSDSTAKVSGPTLFILAAKPQSRVIPGFAPLASFMHYKRGINATLKAP
jgi:hypothetical protein